MRITRWLLFIAIIVCHQAFAQSGKDSAVGGQFSLGMRSTISSFTDAGSVGIGAGGQFWIRIGRHTNTVWYADYIATDVEELGYRRDGHIGWSVIFYLNKNPLKLHKVTPYILAGQCFDYTLLYSNYLNTSAERWSTAAPQGGVGLTYPITKNFDLSLFAIYMLHLGTHIESQISTDNFGQKYLDITHEPGASLDGHLLVTLSVNYLLGKL